MRELEAVGQRIREFFDVVARSETQRFEGVAFADGLRDSAYFGVRDLQHF